MLTRSSGCARALGLRLRRRPSALQNRRQGPVPKCRADPRGDEGRSDAFAEEEDFWADERWNGIGFVFQNFFWIAGLMTALAGGLAAKSYNDGAGYYMTTATSSQDKPKILSASDVERVRSGGAAPPTVEAPPVEADPPAIADDPAPAPMPQ